MSARLNFDARHKTGYVVTFTLDADTLKEAVDKVEALVPILENKGWSPIEASNGQGQPQAQEQKPTPILPDGSPDPGWCPIHNVAMKRREKDGQAWYSHKVGGSWCKGKINGNGK